MINFSVYLNRHVFVMWNMHGYLVSVCLDSRMSNVYMFSCTLRRCKHFEINILTISPLIFFSRLLDTSIVVSRVSMADCVNPVETVRYETSNLELHCL